MRKVRRSASLAAVLIALVASSPSAAPVRAGIACTFTVYVNSNYTEGNCPAETVTLFAPNGTVADRVHHPPTSDGVWSVTWDAVVIAGSKVKAKTSISSRTVIVPKLTARTNRVTDVVNGRAPAGVTLITLLEHRSDFGAGAMFTQSTVADSDGAWAMDFTDQVDVLGSDSLTVGFETAMGDLIYLFTVVPYANVSRSRSDIVGGLDRGVATIELRSASNALRGTATARWSFALTFRASFVNADGRLVNANAGNKVSASFASDASFFIPAVAIDADPSTDVATGTCMANAPYRVWVRRAGQDWGHTTFGHADDAGNVTATLTGWDVEAADRLKLECRLPTGDVVDVTGSVE